MANEQKQQINHTMHINAFLNAISAVDENLEKKYRNKLGPVLELDKVVSVSSVENIYKIISDSYLSLYEEGIVDIIVKILNKCGSLIYTAKLLSYFITGVRWKVEKNSVFYIDEERIKQISYDKEYDAEFKALHLGLFSIMPFIYPGNDPENIKFVRTDIRPLKESSDIDGLQFIFGFKCNYTHYDNECNLRFRVNFSRLRKGIVVQAVQCLNNVNKYNEDIDYCRFIQIGNVRPTFLIDIVLMNHQAHNNC
jgi:hypothetical protein